MSPANDREKWIGGFACREVFRGIKAYRVLNANKNKGLNNGGKHSISKNREVKLWEIKAKVWEEEQRQSQASSERKQQE